MEFLFFFTMFVIAVCFAQLWNRVTKLEEEHNRLLMSSFNEYNSLLLRIRKLEKRDEKEQ